MSESKDYSGDSKLETNYDPKVEDHKETLPLRAEEKHSPDDVASAKDSTGFSIISMNMKDALTGKIHWESDRTQNMVDGATTAYLPKEILQCRAVSREINFSSAQEMSEFRLQQKVIFQGTCIEEWNFKFGFVIPGSTNSWQQVIEAAEEMLPAEALSGNVTIVTEFFDGNRFIAKSSVLIYYE